MQITCSNCQSKIKVPDSAAGKKGKCPKCGTVIAIPAQAPAPEDGPVEEAGGGSPFDFNESAPAAPPRKSRKPAAEEEGEEPAEVEEGEGAASAKKPESPGLSITSLVLGILSLFCGCGTFTTWLCAPLPVLLAAGAIVTGLLGMKRGGKVMGIIGASLGGVSLLLTIVAILVNILVIGAGVGLNIGAMKMGK